MVTRRSIDARQSLGDLVREGNLFDRQAIDITSFVVESWLVHRSPFEYEYEYEYRCTEYEYDCPDDRFDWPGSRDKKMGDNKWFSCLGRSMCRDNAPQWLVMTEVNQVNDLRDFLVSGCADCVDWFDARGGRVKLLKNSGLE